MQDDRRNQLKKYFWFLFNEKLCPTKYALNKNVNCIDEWCYQLLTNKTSFTLYNTFRTVGNQNRL